MSSKYSNENDLIKGFCKLIKPYPFLKVKLNSQKILIYLKLVQLFYKMQLIQSINNLSAYKSMFKIKINWGEIMIQTIM